LPIADVEEAIQARPEICSAIGNRQSAIGNRQSAIPDLVPLPRIGTFHLGSAA
jgi:hypothetical protein